MNAAHYTPLYLEAPDVVLDYYYEHLRDARVAEAVGDWRQAERCRERAQNVIAHARSTPEELLEMVS
jgi:hypothetical protein